MKSLTESMMLFVAVVTAAASCTKSEHPGEASSAPVTVNFTASELGTKTVFGEPETAGGKTSYPVLWTANQKVALFYNYKNGVGEHVNVLPSSDNRSAEFSAEYIKDETAESHIFCAVSPASSVDWLDTEWREDHAPTLYAVIPASQTPMPGTCDEAAQIVVAKSVSETFPQKVLLEFTHLTAYGRIESLTLPKGAGEPEVIKLETNKKLAGTVDYMFDEGWSYYEKNTSSSIELRLDELKDKTKDIFFACVPSLNEDTGEIEDWSDGSWLCLSVTTTDGIWRKTINFTSEHSLVFCAGQVSSFSITADGFEKQE